MYQKIICKLLQDGIKTGLLILQFDDKEMTFGTSTEGAPQGMIRVKNPIFFNQVVLYGEVGLGESYVREEWDSPNLPNVLLILLLNFRNFIPTTKQAIFRPLQTFFLKLHERYFHKNTLTHSEKDTKKGMEISYDIGNDFFALCLGETFTYSCGIFKNQNASLDDAQQHKINVLLQKLDLSPQHKLLEIGCGWGTLINNIHNKYGCEMRGISLSKKQLKYCREKYQFVKFDFLDYRNLTEVSHYDRVVGVECLEHFGYENIPVFINKLDQILKPEGKAVLHFMIRGPFYGREFKPGSHIPSFYGKYIMPVGYMPYDLDVTEAAINSKKFKILHQEKFGMHYVKTIYLWRENLLKNGEEIAKKYSKDLVNAYDYAGAMLMACYESGFLDLLQIVLEKKSTHFDLNVYDPRASNI